MYRLVTKFALFGLRPDHETHSTALRPIPGAPTDFESEQQATNWALDNHDDMRHYPEFVVLPVHRAVLTWRPDDPPLSA